MNFSITSCFLVKRKDGQNRKNEMRQNLGGTVRISRPMDKSVGLFCKYKGV